jgi:hypothetical protein
MFLCNIFTKDAVLIEVDLSIRDAKSFILFIRLLSIQDFKLNK